MDEARWLPLEEAPKLLAYRGEREMAAKGAVRRATYDRRAGAVYALNFYSPIVEDQLRSGRKTATIRLGDKSRKYRKGMIVAVLAGARYSPREKIFDAVIDKVEVKTLGELSPNEIEHDNPEIRRRRGDGASSSGRSTTGRSPRTDLVTVIRFSEIRA